VTVIATGFDRALHVGTARAGDVASTTTTARPAGSPIIQFPQTRPTRVAGSTGSSAVTRPTDTTRSARPASLSERAPQDVTDMEIPTFIRRQMD